MSIFRRREMGSRSGQITKPIRLGALCLLLFLGIGFLYISGLLPTTPTIAQNPTQPLEDETIYMPLIPAQGNTAPIPVPTPVATVPASARVYGLVGTLERPVGQRYTFYLSTANGGYYALAGETPQIEQQIGTLARSSDKPSVKVWGEVLPPEGAGEPPLIVVTGILATEAVVPTPVAGVTVPVAVVKFQLVNLYSGPATTYAVVGKVVQRQACEVTGRTRDNTWLQLTCADGQQGWVDARLVEVTGNVSSVPILNIATATPIPTIAAPTATPTPVSFSGWRTEIYNNNSLSGTPVAVVDVANINFNWGSGGPSQVSADGFSVRFARRITVAPAFYQFTAVADDGIRVWLDGRLIINAWPANPSQTYVVGQVLNGSHDIMVEYYEQSGLANVRMEYGVVSSESAWQASYYYGVTPAGNAAFSQQELSGLNPLQYNWSNGSPYSVALGSTVVGNDYWSARWQGSFAFEGGTYIFRANVDDGIRLYIDGLLVLNYWRDGYKEASNRVIAIGPGQHTIVVEYYERTGNASLQVWWYHDLSYVGPQ